MPWLWSSRDMVGNNTVCQSHTVLIGAGFQVYATARDTKKMVQLEGEGITTLRLDVANPESVAKVADVVSSRTDGKLDVLVNNA
jgi:1-acylglycerone phosphate reductase